MLHHGDYPCSHKPDCEGCREDLREEIIFISSIIFVICVPIVLMFCKIFL